MSTSSSASSGAKPPVLIPTLNLRDLCDKDASNQGTNPNTSRSSDVVVEANVVERKFEWNVTNLVEDIKTANSKAFIRSAAKVALNVISFIPVLILDLVRRSLFSLDAVNGKSFSYLGKAGEACKSIAEKTQSAYKSYQVKSTVGALTSSIRRDDQAKSFSGRELTRTQDAARAVIALCKDEETKKAICQKIEEDCGDERFVTNKTKRYQDIPLVDEVYKQIAIVGGTISENAQQGRSSLDQDLTANNASDKFKEKAEAAFNEVVRDEDARKNADETFINSMTRFASAPGSGDSSPSITPRGQGSRSRSAPESGSGDSSPSITPRGQGSRSRSASESESGDSSRSTTARGQGQGLKPPGLPEATKSSIAAAGGNRISADALAKGILEYLKNSPDAKNLSDDERDHEIIAAVNTAVGEKALDPSKGPGLLKKLKDFFKGKEQVPGDNTPTSSENVNYDQELDDIEALLLRASEHHEDIKAFRSSLITQQLSAEDKDKLKSIKEKEDRLSRELLEAEKELTSARTKAVTFLLKNGSGQSNASDVLQKKFHDALKNKEEKEKEVNVCKNEYNRILNEAFSKIDSRRGNISEKEEELLGKIYEAEKILIVFKAYRQKLSSKKEFVKAYRTSRKADGISISTQDYANAVEREQKRNEAFLTSLYGVKVQSKIAHFSKVGATTELLSKSTKELLSKSTEELTTAVRVFLHGEAAGTDDSSANDNNAAIGSVSENEPKGFEEQSQEVSEILRRIDAKEEAAAILIQRAFRKKKSHNDGSVSGDDDEAVVPKSLFSLSSIWGAVKGFTQSLPVAGLEG